MAWVNIPINHITFRLFEPSVPNATVAVAAADLLLFRYKRLRPDTVIVDFRIKKAFFTPSTAGASGITMELSVPFGSVHFPAIGSPNSFFDAGQTYSNDCVLALDPGSFAHAPGCVAVLNEQNHKVILLLRNVPGDNINANHIGVIGAFGQITFEVTAKPKGKGKGKSKR
jgi:hypothetical protein